MRYYHNTTPVDRGKLAEYINKAESQTDKIKVIFKAYERLTPSEVHKVFNEPNTPLTSIRRAISDLTRDGYLDKTNFLKDGIFGRPEHVYSLSK